MNLRADSETENGDGFRDLVFRALGDSNEEIGDAGVAGSIIEADPVLEQFMRDCGYFVPPCYEGAPGSLPKLNSTVSKPKATSAPLLGTDIEAFLKPVLGASASIAEVLFALPFSIYDCKPVMESIPTVEATRGPVLTLTELNSKLAEVKDASAAYRAEGMRLSELAVRQLDMSDPLPGGIAITAEYGKMIQVATEYGVVESPVLTKEDLGHWGVHLSVRRDKMAPYFGPPFAHHYVYPFKFNGVEVPLRKNTQTLIQMNKAQWIEYLARQKRRAPAKEEVSALHWEDEGFLSDDEDGPGRRSMPVGTSRGGLPPWIEAYVKSWFAPLLNHWTQVVRDTLSTKGLDARSSTHLSRRQPTRAVTDISCEVAARIFGLDAAVTNAFGQFEWATSPAHWPPDEIEMLPMEALDRYQRQCKLAVDALVTSVWSSESSKMRKMNKMDNDLEAGEPSMRDLFVNHVVPNQPLGQELVGAALPVILQALKVYDGAEPSHWFTKLKDAAIKEALSMGMTSVNEIPSLAMTPQVAALRQTARAIQAHELSTSQVHSEMFENGMDMDDHCPAVSQVDPLGTGDEFEVDEWKKWDPWDYATYLGITELHSKSQIELAGRGERLRRHRSADIHA